MSDPVDWALAERVAVGIARRHLVPPRHLLPTDAQLAPLAELAEELVTDLTGLRAPSAAEVHVVDRTAWVRANITSFRGVLADLSAPPLGWRIGRQLTAVELGSLLGWMSTRVLGQYDVLTGSAGDSVLLVGPNLARMEQQHRFDPAQFRLWVTVHELTHRVQFLGVPWMADHYRDLVRRVVQEMTPDASTWIAELRAAAGTWRQLGERLREGGLATLAATEEQRAMLQAVGTLMSLLEGHGEWVMNRVDPTLLPDAPVFDATLRARRANRAPVARLLLRLTGVEAKMRQYEVGGEFIAQVERTAGAQAIDLCWRSPDHLPRWDELHEPGLWLDRVGLVRV